MLQAAFCNIKIKDLNPRLVLCQMVKEQIAVYAKTKKNSEKEFQYYLEIITCDQSKYKMDHPDLTVSEFMENGIGLQNVKGLTASIL